MGTTVNGKDILYTIANNITQVTLSPGAAGSGGATSKGQELNAYAKAYKIITENEAYIDTKSGTDTAVGDVIEEIFFSHQFAGASPYTTGTGGSYGGTVATTTGVNAANGFNALFMANAIDQFRQVDGVAATTIGDAGTTVDSFPYRLTQAQSGGAMTITLQNSAGATPTATASVNIPFRIKSGTAAASLLLGRTEYGSAVAATTLTLDSGATLGMVNDIESTLYIYAINDAGTIKLGITNGQRLDESILHTFIVLDANSDTATHVDPTKLYSDAAITACAVRLIGRMRHTMNAVGTYDEDPVELGILGIGGGGTASGELAAGEKIFWQDTNQYIQGDLTSITIEADDNFVVNTDTVAQLNSTTKVDLVSTAGQVNANTVDFTVRSATDQKPVFTLQNDHDGSTGPVFRLTNNKTSAGAVNDQAGRIEFRSKDYGTPTEAIFAQQYANVADPTNDSKDGKWTLDVVVNDALVSRIIADAAGVKVPALNVTDGDITNVGDIALDTISADGGSLISITNDTSLTSSVSAKPVFTIQNTNADETGGSLIFDKNGTGVADSDVIGNIDFLSEDDASNATTYGRILSKITDASSGAEQGSIDFYVAEVNGALTKILALEGGGTAAATVVAVDGKLTVSGDLTVSGTTTTVNSSTLTVVDPLIELQTVSGGGPLTGDTNKDTGLLMNYFSGSAKQAFLGWDDSVSKLTFVADATESSEVISGAVGTFVSNLEGDVTGAVTGAVTGNITGDTLTAQLYSVTAASSGTLTFNKSNNNDGTTHTAPTQDDVLGQILFKGSSGTAFVTGAAIKGTADETFSGTASGSVLTFHTVDNTTQVLDERIRIDNNGRVGIGIDNPTALLEVEQGSTGGVTAFIIDKNDTDKVAMSIEAANIDADVLDIGADAVTTAKVFDITADALTTGSALYIDDASASTSTRNTVNIIQNHDSAIAATALSVQSDSGVTGVLIDKNFPAAAVAAATVRGLWVDFDHTVPSSGTAAMTDIGIDVDVNSAGLGVTTTTGLDIDVVGATTGTHTAYGLTVDVSAADNNYAAKFGGGGILIKEQAAADAHVTAYGQLWVKTATPNQLWWTDDAGTDTQLGADTAFFGGSASTVALPIGQGSSTTDTNTGLFSAAADRIAISAGGTQRLEANTTGVHVTTLTETSYRELKENITPIEGSLDKIMALQGVNFDWKDGKEKQIGLLADDVAKVVPEVVQFTDKKATALQYSKMVALLIEGMKEQQQEINELKRLIPKT